MAIDDLDLNEEWNIFKKKIGSKAFHLRMGNKNSINVIVDSTVFAIDSHIINLFGRLGLIEQRIDLNLKWRITTHNLE